MNQPGPATNSIATARRAFSLAELMIAIGILGIGLLFIAAALPVGIDYQRQSVDRNSGAGAGAEAVKQVEVAMRVSKGSITNNLAIAARNPNPTTPVNPPIPDSRVDSIQRPRLFVDGDVDPTPGNAFDDIQNDELRRQTAAANEYEPLIKVRPLTMQNVAMSPVGGQPRGRLVVDDAERTIASYLNAVSTEPGIPTNQARANSAEARLLEVDWLPEAFGLFSIDDPSPSNDVWSSESVPAVSAASRAFPPATFQEKLTPQDYVNNFTRVNTPLPFRPLSAPGGTAINGNTYEIGSESLALLGRRFVWTAFYRRLSYDKVIDCGRDVALGAADVNIGDPAVPDTISKSDPYLYEIIVVVSRRSNEQERFPLQRIGDGDLDEFEQPLAVATTGGPGFRDQTGADRLFPTPWLVVFDLDRTTNTDSALPVLSGGNGTAFDYFYDNSNNGRDLEAPPIQSNGPSRRPANRPINADRLSPRATLTFRCKPEVGRLLPVGSVIIPAVNDDFPSRLGWTRGAGASVEEFVYGPPGSLEINGQNGNFRRSGFVPHRPDDIPIYEVVQRPDNETIVVSNNGFYPWVNPAYANGRDAALFPCWIIPPAFTDRTGAGVNSRPVYPSRSPIVSVVRKVIRLREAR